MFVEFILPVEIKRGSVMLPVIKLGAGEKYVPSEKDNFGCLCLPS